MKHLDLALKNKEKDEKSFTDLYSAKVDERIRKRYSVSQELSVMRQKDEKTEEFKAYYEYAEQCKAEVKAMLGMTKEDKA